MSSSAFPLPRPVDSVIEPRLKPLGFVEVAPRLWIDGSGAGAARVRDQKDGVTVGCVEKLLERAHAGDVVFQEFAIILL